MAGHQILDLALEPPGRGGVQHVALGEDADEPLAVEDEHCADLALVHQPDDVPDRRVGPHGQQVAGHDLAHGRHQARV